MKDSKNTITTSSRRSAGFVSPYLKGAVAISGLLPVVWSLYGGISTATGTVPNQDTEDGLMLPTRSDSFHWQHGSSSLSLHNLVEEIPSIQELTSATNNNHQEDDEAAACTQKSFVYIYDVTGSKSVTNNHVVHAARSKIPKIIHQTSKSRCLTKMFAKISEPWRTLPGYDYYLHDDQAMMRLLSFYWKEFPMLHDLVKANCLPHGTLKADIWRYLVLWVYGGIYADLDTQPTALFNTTRPIIQDIDDGWFVVEQFHILSQYVMAVSPRHPLMYYAVHHSINKVMAQVDTMKINAALVTGPHALHRAFQEFCQDAGLRVDPQGAGLKPVKAGIWRGTNQRSITVVGRGENEGEFITREMMSLPLKKRQYAKMNMTSFRDDKYQASGRSCLSALFRYHGQNNHSTYA